MSVSCHAMSVLGVELEVRAYFLQNAQGHMVLNP